MPLYANILEFGGDATGSRYNDDALAAARENNLAVCFPCVGGYSATYLFQNRFGLRNGETWIGAGRKATQLVFPHCYEEDEETGETTHYAAITGHRDCLIKDLSIIGPEPHALKGVGAKGIGFSDQGIRAPHEYLARYKLENVEIRGFAEGIRMTYSWIGMLRDCYVVQCTTGYRYTYPSDNPAGNANAIYFDGGEFQSCDTAVSIETETNLISFHQVTIEGCTNGIVSTPNPSEGARNGIHVTNNYFEHNNALDVDLDGFCPGLAIQNNVAIRFQVPELGMRIQNANGNTRRASITGNLQVIDDNSQPAIEVGPLVQQTHVEGNSVKSGEPAVIDDKGSGTRIES